MRTNYLWRRYKHLGIVLEEKTISGFLTFLEDNRDFQFQNDVEIKSIFAISETPSERF
jgi:hypothetical protein